jgi:hypothetical protein
MAKALGWVTSQNAWGGAGLLLHTRLSIFRMPHPRDSPYTFNFLSEASQEAIFNSDLKCWGKEIQGNPGYIVNTSVAILWTNGLPLDY